MCLTSNYLDLTSSHKDFASKNRDVNQEEGNMQQLYHRSGSEVEVKCDEVEVK
jgi:hypothetical protein